MLLFDGVERRRLAPIFTRRGERVGGGEVDAAPPHGWEPCAGSDRVRRPLVLAGERAWLLVQIVEKPDLTLRAIRAALAARGLAISYDVVGSFYRREGLSFKKAFTRLSANRPRQRPDLDLHPKTAFVRSTRRRRLPKPGGQVKVAGATPSPCPAVDVSAEWRRFHL